MDFDEIIAQVANETAGLAVGRNERGDDNDTVVFQPGRQKTNPADMFIAGGLGKAGIGEDAPQDIAVQLFAFLAGGGEFFK